MNFLSVFLINILYFNIISAYDCTCSSNYYSQQEIDNAITQSGTGNYNRYPHQFKNFEKINFPNCQNVVYEFPIIKNTLYNGNTSPGPDRVIYDSSNHFCGCITHTGASSRNGFVGCVF